MSPYGRDNLPPSPDRQPAHSPSMTAGLALFHGAYYLVTGLWPLLSIETFQMVTGPKTDHLVTGRESDHWLVMTVGVLISVIGLVLLLAGARRNVTAEVVLLAVGSAVGLTLIDVTYVGRHVIPLIYLADAAAEVILIVLWGAALFHERGVPRARLAAQPGRP